MEKYVFSDQITPLPMGSCTFNGAIAETMEKFFFHRINSSDARKKVYQETIDAYRNRIDDERKVIGFWQGEFWGKWVISAVRAARYSGNAELVSFIRSAVYEMLTLQQPDGCISTYKDVTLFHSAPQEEVIKVLGVPCDWNWNIWCRKYTLWGLLEAWELLQEQPVLTAAERLADQLITSLEDTNTDIHDTGTFCGMPSCSILKPMLLLYRYTGRKRFLEFADFIVDGWKRSDGKLPNLINNPLAGKPVHLWGKEPATVWAKTYEMLSCYDGLLEYYRITGSREALEASQQLYKLLKEYELNQAGSVGFNDQFVHAAQIMECITEPCDAIHWMRFCGELFKLTGRPEYLDSFEFAYCNAFLASTHRDGKWGLRGARSSGHHLEALGQVKMLYNHCCVNNMPRGFINAVECAVMKKQNQLYLNFCFPLDCQAVLDDGNRVQLSVSDGYLQYGKVTVTVSADKAFDMQLRIPDWSRKTAIVLNGREIFPAAGTFAALALPAGESCFTVEFDHTVHLCDVSGADPADLDPWYMRRYLSGEQGVKSELEIITAPATVIRIGPVLLARSRIIGNLIEEMFDTPSIHGRKFKCELTPADIEGVFAGFEAVFTSPDGESFTTRVCDYASSGNVKIEENLFFNMFF